MIFKAKSACEKDLEEFHETAEALVTAGRRNLVAGVIPHEQSTRGRHLISMVIINRGLTYEGEEFLQNKKDFVGADGRRIPGGVLTIMFTDIVGSTNLKGQLPQPTSGHRDEEYNRMIKKPHDDLVCGLVTAHEGRKFNSTGDGF